MNDRRCKTALYLALRAARRPKRFLTDHKRRIAALRERCTWEAHQPALLSPPDEPEAALPDLPAREQPLHRLREVGTYGVSTAELLALVLRKPDLELAHRVLGAFNSLATLAHAAEEELIALPGVGPKTAAALRAALELGRRLTLEELQDPDQICGPADAGRLLLALLAHAEQEHFAVLYLNTRHHVTAKEILYKGSLNTSLVRVAEVFKGAIRRNCAAIIVAHNHPSGDPQPSPEDIALTRRLVQAGQLLEVQLLDHLVVGHTRYVSMRQRHLGFDDAPALL